MSSSPSFLAVVLLLAQALLCSARTATTPAPSSPAPEDQAEEIGSPLTVAQCRAQCLLRLTQWERPGQCMQSPDCYMCWENCQLLQSNFPVWGAMCNEKSLCFPGCQQACAFHRRLRGSRGSRRQQQQQAVVLTGGQAAVRARGSSVWWPAPAPAAAPGAAPAPLVYVLMRRTSAPQPAWTQITQTVELSAPLPEDMVSRHNLRHNLRVLVVGPDGLHTIYSPAAPTPAPTSTSPPPAPSSTSSTEGPSAASQRRINTAIKPAGPAAPQPAWTLREVSLIHQKVLVIAELSWAPRGPPGGVYLVTWEVDGGGLKGNLFTDSTHVTLSLWPETVYHIQVEQVSESKQSATLVLDTHRALPSTLGSPVGSPLASRGPTASSRIPLSIAQQVVLAPPPIRMQRVLGRPSAGLLTAAVAVVLVSLLLGAALVWRCRASLFRRRTGAVGDSSPFIGALVAEEVDTAAAATEKKVSIMGAAAFTPPPAPQPQRPSAPSAPSASVTLVASEPETASCRSAPCGQQATCQRAAVSPSWRHANMVSSWTFGANATGTAHTPSHIV